MTFRFARIGLFAHRRDATTHGLPQILETLFWHPLIGIDRDETILAGVSIGGQTLSRDSFAFRCDSDGVQLMAVKAGFGIGAC